MSKTKLSAKKQESITVEALWTVLINCPFGEKSEWVQARNQLIHKMFIYFSHDFPDKKLAEDFRGIIVHEMNSLSIKAYNGKMFKDLNEDHKIEVVYTCLRNICSSAMLYHFYKYAINDKPTHYCPKCKRFSSSTVQCG